MRPETILNYVRATPFRPFRLNLNSGEAYEVRHPEMIRVGRDSFNYYYATPDDGPYDRWDTVSLLLIKNIQHPDAPAPAHGEGSKI